MIKILLIGLFLSVFVLMDWYFLRRFKKFITAHKYSVKFYTAMYWAAIVGFAFLVLNIALRMSDASLSPLQWFSFSVATIWYLPKFIIVPFLLISNLIKGVHNILKKEKTQEKTELDIKRRRLLRTGAWALAAAPYAVIAKGAIHTTYNLRLKRISLPIDKLSPAISGFKICHISDLHAGAFPNANMMMETADMINAQHPDIIAITGDIVNFNPNEIAIIADGLKALKSKYGVYACLGNHDHYMSNAEHLQLINSLKNVGIDVLINENRTIQANGASIQIAGIDDLSFKNTFGDFDLAMNNLNPEIPTIMLAHDPTVWGKSIKDKLPIDLTLSGHTHGGQIVFNYLFGSFAPASMMYKYWLGLYSEAGKYLYVNPGLGTTGPPIRIGIPPEVTSITLVNPAV